MNHTKYNFIEFSEKLQKKQLLKQNHIPIYKIFNDLKSCTFDQINLGNKQEPKINLRKKSHLIKNIILLTI